MTTTCDGQLLLSSPLSAPTLNLNNNKNGVFDTILPDQEQPGFPQISLLKDAPIPELTNGIDHIFQPNEFNGDIDDEFEHFHQDIINDSRGRFESSSRFKPKNILDTIRNPENFQQNDFWNINIHDPEAPYPEVCLLILVFEHQHEYSSRIILRNTVNPDENLANYDYFAYNPIFDNLSINSRAFDTTKLNTTDNQTSDRQNGKGEPPSPWLTESET